MEIQDFMFGDNIEPGKRLEKHTGEHHGVQHRARVFPAKPRPGEPIEFRVTTAGELPFELVQVFYTLDGSKPGMDNSLRLELTRTSVGWDQVGWQYLQEWSGALAGQADDAVIRYVVGARLTGSQRWIFADNQVESINEATLFAIWVSNLAAPAWSKDALVYHVFLDRFNPGEGKTWKRALRLNEFFGGTIKGVEEKLEYIQWLGFNTIWLSPFFASPTHHGYDATDLYTVEPRLGTNEDLYRLIEAVHRRGMKVILDFVANHWSNQHPSMQAAQKDRSSPYYDWYLWKRWPDQYEGFFDTLDLPRLNLKLGSPARQYLLECARYWLEKGFDGYRLDFAYGPPLDFWVDFRRTCKKTKPESWLFGEVILSAPDQMRFAGAFDGQIDFLLCEALRQTFGYQKWSLAQFEAFLSAHERYFEGTLERLTILDNHDMNRFLFLSGNNVQRLKLGALVLYTLAGSPINYYGTEAGVTQERPTHYGGYGYFEEARARMLWGSEQNQDLLETFRRLVMLRAAHPALRDGSRAAVLLDEARGLYGYRRVLEGESILVLFNTGKQPQQIELVWDRGDEVVELLSGIPIKIENDRLAINLPPESGAIIG